MSSLQRFKSRMAGFKAEGELYERQDIRSAFAANTTWSRCSFLECQLDLASFEGAIFEDCTFTSCQGRLANFRLSNRIRNVVFDGCDLEQGSFAGSSFDGVVFKDCRLSLASFEKATLKGVVFRGCNLHGADLRYYRASTVSYVDCNLWGIQIAVGCQFFNGQFDERSRQLFAGILARTWPVSEERAALSGIAGDKLAVVERLMGEDET